jgi:hypothetical protein
VVPLPFDADPFGRCTCTTAPPAIPDDFRMAALCTAIDVPGIGTRIHLTACLWGGEAARTVPLTVGQAYELGHELMALAQAVFLEEPRPWDNEPGRVFAGSPPPRRGPRRPGRSRTRPAQPASQPDGRPASGRVGRPPARASAPPLAPEESGRRSRPTRGVESPQ